MTQADLISPARFLARLPQHLPRLGRMLRGLYYAGIRNRDKTLSLAWALERATRLFPDSPALMDETRRLSYRQFNAWANRIAHVLRAEGVLSSAEVREAARLMPCQKSWSCCRAPSGPPAISPCASSAALIAPADVALMRESGVGAFLVGEAFMRAASPGQALAALFA